MGSENEHDFDLRNAYDEKRVKWGEILPKLRKSVRKFHPLESVG